MILCRDRDGKLYGLVNSCRHRGNRVCRWIGAMPGASSVRITAYNTKGNLIGVPGKTELYKDDIDQPSLGLVRGADRQATRAWCSALSTRKRHRSRNSWATCAGAGPAAGPGRSGRGAGRGALEHRGQLEVRRRQRDRRYVPRRLDSSLGHAGHLGGNGAQSLAQYAPTRERRRASPAAYGHGLNADFAEADEVDLGSPLAAWRLDPAVQARLGPCACSART